MEKERAGGKGQLPVEAGSGEGGVELPTFFGKIFMTNFLEVYLNLMQLADWTQSRVCLALPLTTLICLDAQ